MYDLLIKCQDIFLDHFSSLGVFCKVQQLTGYDDSSKNNKDKQVDLRQVCFYFDVLTNNLYNIFYFIKICFINCLV